MEWTPLIIGLTIAYFMAASVTTFIIRVKQAQRLGEYDDQPLPSWVAVFIWMQWIIFAVLLYINWKYALVLFAIKYVLKVLPVLETIGNILMSPFKQR